MIMPAGKTLVIGRKTYREGDKISDELAKAHGIKSDSSAQTDKQTEPKK